jgi:ABC-type Fe3+ transport system permease subunit
MPLVAFSTGLIAARIGQSARDATLLCGGIPRLVKYTLWFVFPGAVAMACTGALLTLGDSGVGQIMGFHGAPSEVLIAFSARGDLATAMLKAVTTSVLFSPLIIVVAWTLLRNFDLAPSPRGMAAPVRQMNTSFSHISVSVGLFGLAAILLAPALIGLGRPLFVGIPPWREFASALMLWWDSSLVTLTYWALAGICATTLGSVLAAAALDEYRMRQVIFFFCLLCLTIPSAIPALAAVWLRTHANVGISPVLGSDSFSAAVIGLHFVPISVAILLPAFRSLPRRLWEAAEIQGISIWRYGLRVQLPMVSGAVLTSVVVVGLLALADVSTASLLQQPGHSTFGGHLFAVMDNSSEKNVAALCAVYAILPTAILGGWILTIGLRNSFQRTNPS